MSKPLLLFLALCLWPFPATAAEAFYPPPWPVADVSLTIPASEESESNALYNLFSEAFATQTGKKLSFRYVPGLAGATAWARMVDDKQDGTALTAVTYPEFFLRTAQPDSGIAPESMLLCHVAAYSPCILWGDFDSLQAFIDAAQIARGDLLVAGPGSYSAGQTAARALDRLAGIKTLYIPYAESAGAAIAGNERKVKAFWAYSMLPKQHGTLRPLAVAAEQRMPSLPDVPTFLELGINLIEGSYYAIAVPAGTHKETVSAIATFFSGHAETEKFRAQALSLGFVPMNLALEDIPEFLDYVQGEASRKIEEYSLYDQ